MSQLSIDLDYEVYCDECGERLQATAYESKEGAFIVNVHPCERCLDSSYEEGRSDEKGAKLRDNP